MTARPNLLPKKEEYLDNKSEFDTNDYLHFDLLAFLYSEAANTQSVRDLLLHPESGVLLGNSLDAKTSALLRAYISFSKDNFHCKRGSFKFALPSAVHRQFSFAKKMHDYGWLHAPFVESTINRARARYEMFLLIVSESPNAQIVPTPEVDLVWHTHQLSPQKYHDFCLWRIGRLYNHDDSNTYTRVESDNGTSKTIWENRFGTPYSVCFCLSCEASRGDGGIIPEERLKVATTKVIDGDMSRSRLDRLEGLVLADSGCTSCRTYPERKSSTFLNRGYSLRPKGTKQKPQGETCSCVGCDAYCDCGGPSAGCTNSNCSCTVAQDCIGYAGDLL
jgi:hypothetical protein